MDHLKRQTLLVIIGVHHVKEIRPLDTSVATGRAPAHDGAIKDALAIKFLQHFAANELMASGEPPPNDGVGGLVDVFRRDTLLKETVIVKDVIASIVLVHASHMSRK